MLKHQDRILSFSFPFPFLIQEFLIYLINKPCMIFHHIIKLVVVLSDYGGNDFETFSIDFFVRIE